MTKIAYASFAMLAGIVTMAATAEAACSTFRQGNRSVTNCDGLITTREGNRSKTFNRDGSTTERRGNSSVTRGGANGVTTFRKGNESVTFQR